MHRLPDGDHFDDIFLPDAADVFDDLIVCDDFVYDDVPDVIDLLDVDINDVDVHLVGIILLLVLDDDHLADNVSLGDPDVDFVILM